MRACFAASIVVLLASTSVSGASSPYDRAFDDVVAHYRPPGLAVGVIEDGKVVYVRTHGELVAGGGRKVTPETLFKIASNSKAMTASVLARLVDAGKLRWDDPVTKHLPQFRMFDPWVTRQMQVRDLLIHNSGLPEGAGDLMLWPEPNHFTRADIIAGLAHLKPAYSFRAGYSYDNLLYVVAGEVAAAAGGASYEELVRREVFAPLGLRGCRVGRWRSDAVRNVAQPHMRKGDRNVVIRSDGEVVPEITSAAAGGIRCSLNDMLAWALTWLAPDEQQRAWLSADQRRAMWTPQTPMPLSQRRRERDHSHYYAYAYGWRLLDVDGVWTVSHTGSLMGMYSVMTLLPDRRAGFVMLTNGDGSEARAVLNQVLLKHFAAPDAGVTVADVVSESADDASASSTDTAPDTTSRTPVAAVEWPHLGVWRDPWFGDVSVCARRDTVRFTAAKSPRLSGQLMRVGERTLVDWDDATVDAEAWLSFAESDGTPTMTMAKVDPAADFSFDFEHLAFIRTAECP